MKLKGIKPLEQNIDKIVIALAAVAGAGLLMYQFISPNEVVVGKAKETPARAFKPVENEARELERRLNLPAIPDSLVAPTISVSDKLAIGRTAKFGEVLTEVAFGPSPAIGKAAGAGPIAAVLFQLPSVPAPSDIAVHAFRSSIHPVEVVRRPELAKSGLIPAQQPFDKAAVSIEVGFSGLALKDALMSDPDGSGPLEPIPLAWWRDPANEAADLLAILSVQTERETIRNADGSTPKTPTITTVAVLPGHTDTLAMWNSDVKAIGDVPPYVEQMKYLAEDIQRPTYFATIYGPEWKPPSEASQATEGDDKSRTIELKRKELKDIDEKIADLQARIAAGGGGRPAPEGPRNVQPGRGGGGGGKGGGGEPRPSARDSAPKEVNVKALENQVKSQNERRKRVVKALENLGEKVDAAPEAAAAAAPANLPMLENPEITLFAHDFAAEPGAQYRYRTRIIINNPLFGRNLQESQKKLGEAKIIESAWSEWSRPVEVDPDSVYFITSAEPAGPFSPTPRAVAEMFVFHYGYYRSATVSLDPGDQLIAPNPRLPDGLKIADIQKMEEAMKVSGDTNPPPMAAPPPMDVAPGGGGKGRGRDGAPEPSGGGRPGGPPPGPAAVPTLAMLPEWMSIECPPPRNPKVDAIFLDTTPSPVNVVGLAGESRMRFQALFRNAIGQVLLREPDVDRANDSYKRLQASAKAGETQGQPKVAPEADRSRPIPPPRDLPPPPGRPGRGGGGGGG